MKIAVVTGGWHYPLHFYRLMSEQTLKSDLFVIGHREPPGIPSEKNFIKDKNYIWPHDLIKNPDYYNLDRILYKDFATRLDLETLGWNYTLEENLHGDFGYTNQWLMKNDWKKYDIILSCHDDLFILNNHLLEDILTNKVVLYQKNKDFDIVNSTNNNWRILFNSTAPTKNLSIRFPMVFLKRDVIELMNGKLDLSNVVLSRIGKTDTPNEHADLAPWNQISKAFRDFIDKHNLYSDIKYLSKYFRVSKYCIECERGFIHRSLSWPDSFSEGMSENSSEIKEMIGVR